MGHHGAKFKIVDTWANEDADKSAKVSMF